MMPESGCSRKNLGAWREYHQHRQHSHNTLKGQLSYQAKLLNLGMTLALNFQVQTTGGGGRMTQDGIHYGLHFQKRQILVMNNYAVDARKGALYVLNVSRLS